MKIRIESSGGIGNVQIKGELDFKTLPLELQQQVKHILDQLDSSDFIKSTNQNLVDGIEYNLTIFPDNKDSVPHQVLLSEAKHDKAIMRVGKTLLREVIKHKAK